MAQNDHPLPAGNPEQDIERVKRLQIYLSSDGNVPIGSLRFHIQGYTAADQNEEGGTWIPAGSSPDQLIQEFLQDDTVSPPLLETPLDFALQEKCHVVLKLVGGFWEFSGDAIKTKTSHGDRRYYNLRLHSEAGRTRCVSFCARKPLPKDGNGKSVRHGINLYVDFLQDNLRLPVIIDPDIENKGGNNV